MYFIKYLNFKFSIQKSGRKIENWHELDFSEFVKTINEAIKKSGGEKLSKSDKVD